MNSKVILRGKGKESISKLRVVARQTGRQWYRQIKMLLDLILFIWMDSLWS